MTMKRILSYLTIPALFLAAAACAPKEEIKFAHEEQAFDTRSDRILVEAILPQATAADDEVYIIGAFNGGIDAVGNSAYRLTRSVAIPAKWGVYVDPSAFQGGKTLADGFTFYNVQQGLERGPKNEDVTHKLTIGTGEWANVYADKWAKYFAPPEEPDDDPYADYTQTSTWGVTGALPNQGINWDGDIEMITNGTWHVARDVQLSAGDQFKFRENGGWDVNFGGTFVALGEEFEVTQGGDNIIIPSDGTYDLLLNPGAAVAKIIVSGSGGGSSDPRAKMTETSPWGVIGSIASTGNSWGADEPMVTDGTWHACLNLALTATDEFKFRKDGGWDVNFGGAFAALGEPFEVKQDGANIKVAEDGTYDLFLNPETAQVVIVVAGEPVTLPSGEGGGDTPDPPVEQPKDPVTIYVQDLSGWEAVNLYMWGDKNVAGADLCGAWPGMAPAEKTVKIGTVNYKVFTVEDALGRAENLIFNGEGGQAKDISLTLESETFIKLEVVDGTLTGTVIDPRNPDIKILVNNKTDWDAIALYAYGDAEAFGGWPGATPVGFEEVKGVKYTVFGLPAEMAGKSLNLIFNNNGGGKQLAEFAITVPEEELFLNINANYYVDNVEGNPRGEDSYIYVIDNMGWGADLHMYAWGDSEVFGGWPGTAGEYVGTFCGVPAYRFLVPAAASGNTEHLIFNNGNGGEGNQFDGPEVVVGENLQYSIASDFTWAEASLATRVYVQDETGWDQVCLYVWGTSEIFGGWPGASPAGTEEIGGVTYKYFEVPASAFGNTANFILNNGGNGSQLENFDCLKGQTVNRDYYFHFTADNVTVVE